MQNYNIESIQNLFDGIAGRYSEYGPGDIADYISMEAFKMLNLTESDVLLDIGTGSGRFALKAAKMCKKVIAVDLSEKMLKLARENSDKKEISNIDFIQSPMEDVGKISVVKEAGVNKVLFNYSLHHLTDDMKKETIENLASTIKRPGRIVMGDVIFFTNPADHIDVFDEVDYDGGETDFPATIEFFEDMFRNLNGKIEIRELHPIAGIIVADFQ